MTAPLDKIHDAPPIQSADLTVPEDDGGSVTIVQEFIIFLRENRKWWLIPIIFMVGLLGLLLFLGTSTPLGALLYSLL